MPAPMKVYLAGPEVFLPNGREVIEAKQALTRRYGFEPNVWLGEGEPPPAEPFAFGLYISAANEAVMRDSDLIIANLTPFRGISADIGTAYELGFMCAMGKPAFGYTNDPRGYVERLTGDFYAGKVEADAEGVLRGTDGLMVEDHGMVDNLMVDGGIDRNGGVIVRRRVEPARILDDLGALEECLGIARDRLPG
ncbi:Nucleoside 2-deoxyribosyltransferase [Faunimonas pinastri]|uniref:Nucleoside 2-deoxyribosyltransferase n=1 Tax=Faunimonas pinastri TaxID=1855383 RepID=A0A1H9B1X4_9HYPH|nr:nucleoside 2-deoxyribosyltransferase [Faunimonas pinastri]SEP83036.1 Nucleoside 2-deoxyribosyltransferase [Faunimonas pinastri]